MIFFWRTYQTFIHTFYYAKSLQSCPTLRNPIDGSPPGSPVPGILQARTLEWVAISFSSDLFLKVASRAFPEIILNIFYIFSKMVSAIQNESKKWRVPESLELPKCNLNFISPHNNYQDRNLAYCVLKGFYVTRNDEGFLVDSRKTQFTENTVHPSSSTFHKTTFWKKKWKNVWLHKSAAYNYLSMSGRDIFCGTNRSAFPSQSRQTSGCWSFFHGFSSFWLLRYQ